MCTSSFSAAFNEEAGVRRLRFQSLKLVVGAIAQDKSADFVFVQHIDLVARLPWRLMLKSMPQLFRQRTSLSPNLSQKQGGRSQDVANATANKRFTALLQEDKSSQDSFVSTRPWFLASVRNEFASCNVLMVSDLEQRWGL
jgi:hypothetical protein